MSQSGTESLPEDAWIESEKKDSKKVKLHRTPRACDRCRLKKSKCDGHQPCASCTMKERTCGYSSHKRYESKTWSPSMREAVEEAVQRLYRASRDSNAFPGVLPTETGGFASTGSILHGLGLEATLPQDFLSPKQQVSDEPPRRHHSFDEAKTTFPSLRKAEPTPTTIRSRQEHHSNAVQPHANLSKGCVPQLESQTSLDMQDQFNEAMETLDKQPRHFSLSSISSSSPSPSYLSHSRTINPTSTWPEEQNLNLNLSPTSEAESLHSWTTQALFDNATASPDNPFVEMTQYEDLNDMLARTRQVWEGTIPMADDDALTSSEPMF